MTAINLAWVYLVIAGLFEALWAMGLKFSEGFTKPLPIIVLILIGIIGLKISN